MIPVCCVALFFTLEIVKISASFKSFSHELVKHFFSGAQKPDQTECVKLNYIMGLAYQ